MSTESDAGPLEAVYDAEISPLMRQIITIAKRAKIPMHASFCLDGDLACSTHVDTADEATGRVTDWRSRYAPLAHRALAGSASPMMINTRDASGTVVRSEVVL